MYINVSPITWTRETYSDPSSKRSFMRTRTVRDQGNFLYIDGNASFSCRDPRSLTYYA